MITGLDKGVVGRSPEFESSRSKLIQALIADHAIDDQFRPGQSLDGGSVVVEDHVALPGIRA